MTKYFFLSRGVAQFCQASHLAVMQYTAKIGQNLIPSDWQDYQLVDSGHGRKLERFGRFHFVRPEMQALWEPRQPQSLWDAADGVFLASADDSEQGGKWQLKPHVPDSWELGFETVRFAAMPTPFRHLGFFPEQSVHWQWCAEQITAFIKIHNRPPRILNLFAYSGVASLHAAAAGAEVTHLDASKKAVAQAFANRDLSGLPDAPIRFITDDAIRFVEREARRERSYDGIILDPPKYGRGPKGEVWQLSRDLPKLLTGCRAILSETPLFLVATLYAIRTSTVAVHSAIASHLQGLDGTLTSGEIAIAEDGEEGRAIGQALYVRYSGLPPDFAG